MQNTLYQTQIALFMVLTLTDLYAKLLFFFFSSECTVMCFERFHLLLLYYCVEYLLKYLQVPKESLLWSSLA